MNESINSSHYLYNKYDDLSSLELTVRNHPLSSFARLLLLKQYQKTENPRFDQLATQSAVYFNDPQWLAFQLLRDNAKKSQSELEHETVGLVEEEAVVFEDSVVPDEPVSEDKSAISSRAELENTEIEKIESVDPIQIEEESEEKDFSSDMEDSISASDPDLSGKNTNTADVPVVEKEAEEVPTENASEEELIFTPLHATDYFASQGVKIKEGSLTNDKLGKQMKSFSEWLKSMKQLHPNKLPEQNEVIEKIIQSSAEQSNIGSEVLTEAMAEVLIKQNKQQKAIEMYEKLSLINPSKSIYFAAKIDKIKNN